MLTVGDLAVLMEGQMVDVDPLMKVKGFATDSREILPGNAFLAIRGARVDGHDYAEMAARSGASVVVSERGVPAPHILVDDIVSALARMASKCRANFRGKVIAVTGSAGKTTTKEFLAAALGEAEGRVVKTAGNRNTEYTVPLVWADIPDGIEYVVVEMSMRGFNQVRHLSTFSRPDIGIVTNIGYAHIEMVGSRQGIAQAKGELLEALPEDGLAILWQGDEFLNFLSQMAPGQVKTFGFSAASTCRITIYEPLSWTQCRVVGTLEGEAFDVILPSVGKHVALNAAAALLAAHAAGVGVQEACARMEKAELPPMRMQILNHSGATIVLDTYNASPPGVIAALETIAALPISGRRFAVLGEMRELGEFSETAHRSIGTTLASSKIDQAVLVGPQLVHTFESAIAGGMKENSLKLVESHAEITAFLRQLAPGDVVLIKGSRALELEKCLDPLGVAR